MGNVKPTPEYPLAVVPYRPYRHWWSILIVLVIVSCVATGSYYFGFYKGGSISQQDQDELQDLRQSTSEKLARIDELEQQVANFALGSQVDRKATEKVRNQVVELKNRIAELERDNTFYRDVMRPDNENQGISIGVPTITALSEANAYEYKMVVKQLDTKRLQVGGYLEFVIVGQNGGVQKRIPLKDISDKDRIKLNFRYFQRIEGRMVLPQEFTPDRIELKLVSVRPKKALIEKQFNWAIKES